jgi:hypothetical protein
VQAALELYDILSESNIDLRQPVGLEEQLLKDDVLDTEVGQSMLQLLQVCTEGASHHACSFSQHSHHHLCLFSQVVTPAAIASLHMTLAC